MITRPNVKLNLGLHVLRRREDGYHDLETLFVPFTGFSDTLEIITGDDYSRTSAHLQETYSAAQMAQGISPDGKLMVTLARKEGVDWDPMKGLTTRAYFLLAERYDLPPMKIYLEKTSPVGAGLGGGSADAAFALRTMAELGGLALSDGELAALAARLGSDCAVFVYNRPMLGTGRGEILEPFDIDLSEYRLEVTVPEGIAVSTADAYRGIVPKEPALPLREVLARPVSEWKDLLVNDFETTVFAKFPALAEIKQSFYDRGASYAAMSGSGSALFALWRR
ncbi:MAG: 4-(cytidine 5'-diphospho)-2-C-methyl-D-erythritol kinase [Bacteroidales bacterium]|nr:4-(cytidine 5'-diphospho)-2-C-methyl-D-erythritol kinase [Bacteroidales bacterium]